MHGHRTARLLLVGLVLALAATACSDGETGPLTIYSGRSEDLVGPLLDRFETETGIDVEVRYASSTDLTATLREEGANSPADVFFAQDPASLGAVAEAGLLTTLPADLLALVPARFSDDDGRWIGVSARVRVVVYDATRLAPADLPESVDGFIDPAWRGRLGIAPSNASFLAFVAAMILERGEAATRDWLDGLAANDPQIFPNNSSIVAAVDEGTVEVGLVNHYYLLQLQAEVGETNAANHFLATAGPGSLVMPAGAGILTTTDQPEHAERFVEFLLGTEAQEFFVAGTHEYPVVDGVSADPGLPALTTLPSPDIDLSELAGALDLATDLVAEAGLL
jgi:iron(III) transport system substrate-binding protein